MKDDATLISERLNVFLKERNLTINRLAVISNLSQSSVNNLYDGSTKSPKITTIRKICAGLDISVHDFFNFPPYNEVEK